MPLMSFFYYSTILILNKEIEYFNIIINYMAHVEVSKLGPQELAELACTYAALILHDDGQDITGTSLLTQVRRLASWSLLQE